MPRRIRLLAVDVDGTLVNGKDQITACTTKAICECESAGIRVVVATGRQYRRVLPISKQLGLDVPLITASGALIKHPSEHRTIFQAEFDRNVLHGMLEVIAKCGYDAVLYTDSYTLGYDYMTPRIEGVHREAAEFFEKVQNYVRILPNLMAAPPEGVFAGFAIGTREEMLRVQTELEQSLPGQLYIHVIRSPRYSGYMCEIAPRGITKWSAITHLADDWGISADETCAVGDDVNDIPMLRGAGLGVAVANAKPEVLAVSDRIAPSNEEDALVTVVNWLLDT